MPPRGRRKRNVLKTDATAAKAIEASTENISDDGVHIPSDHPSAEADYSTSLISVPGKETQSTSQHVSEGNDNGGRKDLASISLKLSSESLNSEDSLSKPNQQFSTSNEISQSNKISTLQTTSFNQDKNCSSSEPSLPIKKYRKKLCKSSNCVAECPRSEKLCSKQCMEMHLRYQCIDSLSDDEGRKRKLNVQDSLPSTSLKLSKESLILEDSFSKSNQHFTTSNETSQSKQIGPTSVNQDKNYSKMEPSLPVKKVEKKQYSILSFQKPSSNMVKCPDCKRYFFSRVNLADHLSYNCISPLSCSSGSCSSGSEYWGCSSGPDYCEEHETSDDSHQFCISPRRISYSSESTVNSFELNLHSQENNVSTNFISGLEDEKFEIPPLRQKLKIHENSNCNSSLAFDSEKCIPFSNDNPSLIHVNSYQINSQQRNHISNDNVVKSTSINVSNGNNTKTFGRSVKKQSHVCNSDGNKAKICAKSKSIATNLTNLNITKLSKMVLRKSLAVNSSDADRAQSSIKVSSTVTNISDSNLNNTTISRRKSFAFENSGGDRNKLCSKSIATKLDDSNISKPKVFKVPVTRSHAKDNSYAVASNFKKVVQQNANGTKSVERKIPESVSRRFLRKSLAVDTSDTDRAEGSKKLGSTVTNIHDSNFSKTTISRRKSLVLDNSGGDRNKLCTKSKSIATMPDDSNISKTKVINELVTRSHAKENPYANGSSFNKVVQKNANGTKSVETSDTDGAEGSIKVDSTVTNIHDSNFSKRTISRRKSLVFENSLGDRNKLCTKSKSIATMLDDSNISKTKVSKEPVTRSHAKENSYADGSSFKKVVQKNPNGTKSVERKISESVSRWFLRKSLAVDTSDTDRAEGSIKLGSTVTNIHDSNFSKTTISRRKSHVSENYGGDRNKLCSKSIGTMLDDSNISRTKVIKEPVTRSHAKENSYADGFSFKKVVQKNANGTKSAERNIAESVSRQILRKPPVADNSNADRAHFNIKAKSGVTNLDSKQRNITVYRRILPKPPTADNSDGDKVCAKSIATNLDDPSISNKADLKGTVTGSRAAKKCYADGSSFKKVVQKNVNGSKSVERKISESVSRQILRKPPVADNSNADRVHGDIKAKSRATNFDSKQRNITVCRRLLPKSTAANNSDGDKACVQSKSVATNLDDPSISNKKDVKGTVTRSCAKQMSYADGSSFKKVVQETVNCSKSDARVAKAAERKLTKSTIHNVGDIHKKILNKSAKSTTIDNFDDNGEGLKRGVRKSAGPYNPGTESFKGPTFKSSESSSRIKIRPSPLPIWKK